MSICPKSISAACVALALALAPFSVSAQFNQGRGGFGGGNNDDFNSTRADNFNDYRASLNQEYARMLREGHWDTKPAQDPAPRPKDDVRPVTNPYDKDKDRKDDRQVKIDEVVTPDRDKSRAQPIAPVREDPDTKTTEVAFTYLGIPAKVRVPAGAKFSLRGSDANAMALGWETLSHKDFAPMVADCQKLKSSLQLCDWAYLKMIEAFAQAYANSYSERSLLTAYIFSQSGYKVRLARSGNGVEMLYGSRHTIYGIPYFRADGDIYYPLNGKLSGSVQICPANFPKEKSLSLWVNTLPTAADNSSTMRRVSSKRYPEFSVEFSTNKNLIDFYNTYPTSYVGSDIMTRWAMYANTPVSPQVRNTLYPRLASLIAGKDKLQAVECILNWIQTGFVYEYDDKVWGGDRAFFAEESLYYPYCDCEDRSILLTRLVRDLLGLKCMLIYYPGHLAAAVAFDEPVNGDYIMVNGKKFVVADPTFIGAPVGRTMTGMDNSSAKVIVLD